MLRDVIVYPTCLHESGHAFGRSHTARFDDIMYSFGYGGDILDYFSRFRRKLNTRDDLRDAWDSYAANPWAYAIRDFPIRSDANNEVVAKVNYDS